jgi:hypothetical protein
MLKTVEGQCADGMEIGLLNWTIWIIGLESGLRLYVLKYEGKKRLHLFTVIL